MKVRILIKNPEDIKNPCRLSGSPEDAIRYAHWEAGKKTVFDATKEIDIDDAVWGWLKENYQDLLPKGGRIYEPFPKYLQKQLEEK